MLALTIETRGTYQRSKKIVQEEPPRNWLRARRECSQAKTFLEALEDETGQTSAFVNKPLHEIDPIYFEGNPMQ